MHKTCATEPELTRNMLKIELLFSRAIFPGYYKKTHLKVLVLLLWVYVALEKKCFNILCVSLMVKHQFSYPLKRVEVQNFIIFKEDPGRYNILNLLTSSI
jgi:hypothetical protein